MAAGELPELVQRAQRLAAEVGFTESCSDEAGRLLRVLARRCRRAGELGTGTGVGAAWIVTGLAPGGSLVTIEADRGRAQAARTLFDGNAGVRVRHGDWRGLLAEPPFDLLFADAGDAWQHGDEILRALSPGGLVVLDDIPPGAHERGDRVRSYWLGHEGLAATEVQVSPTEAVIVAARLP